MGNPHQMTAYRKFKVLIIIALNVLLCTTSSSQLPWADRPFYPPFASDFQWTPSDSAGQAQWRVLRENWDTHAPLPFQESAPLENQSAWGWWWRSDAAGWMVLAGGAFLAAGGVGWWRRRRDFPRTDLAPFAEHWPELHVVAEVLHGRPRDATFAAALSQIHQRLSPAAPTNRPEWNVLNDSERECAELILKRLNPNEIARMMHCTPKHVYNLRSNIRKKLDFDPGEDLYAELQRRFGA